MTRARPSGARTTAAVGLAIAAAVVVNALLPTGPPLLPWYGPGETGARFAAAAALGPLICLVAASGWRPHRVPARLRMLRAGFRRRATGWTWLAARAVVEEAVWRACVMAAIVPAFGLPAAVALSSVGFGVWHARQGLRGILSNTVNGAAFAGSYLLGGLPGAVVAHALYNVTLASILVGRPRQMEPAQPTQGESSR